MTLTELRQKVADLCREKHLVDFEASASWPVPLVFAGRTTYRFLVYLNLPQPQPNTTLVYYPTMSVEIDPDTFEMVATRQYRSNNDPSDLKPIGQFSVTDAQLAELKLDMPGLIAKFDTLYQKAIHSFIKYQKEGGEFDFSQEEKDELAQYFKILIPQPLMASYVDLEAHFFSLLGIYYK